MNTRTHTAMKLLTVRQAADQLAFRPRTVARWCREGKIPAKKVGRVWRIDSEEIRRVAE